MTNGQVTMGTLIHMAREGGWQGDEKDLIVLHRDRLKPIAWPDLQNLPKREYLVKGLLDNGSVSVVFGQSNSGKTFLALDLALHITLGRNWCNRKVRQGAVVYIAAEGGVGLEERLTAFKKHHQLSEWPPFFLIPSSVDLCNSESDIEKLVEEINNIPDVVLIVVDTLSRALSGGDENSSTDMGSLIANADRLKEDCNAHVMFIHHSGKDANKGARGHSLLRAAVDTEIKVEQGEGKTITAEVTKQRNGKTEVKHGFLLTSVLLGTDEDGDIVESCVLYPTELSTRKRKLSPQRTKAVDLMRQLQEENAPITLDAFKSELKKAGITKTDKPDNVRRTIAQLISGLKNDGAISVNGDFVSLPDNSDKIG